MTLNVCQAGHTFHESKLVETMYGPLNIWDWEQYMGFPNYCPAQDEVSKSIDLQQVWERADTAFFRKVLEAPGPVLDFGSHIGWFTVQAAELGCTVLSFDSDPENVRLLKQNVDLRRQGRHVSTSVTLGWVSALSPRQFQFNYDHYRVFKSDLEGHEHEALALTRHLWQDRKIDFGLWELSPIFEKREGIMAESYAALVDEIASYGYRWWIWKGEDRWYIEGKDLQEFAHGQENGWCEKLP